MPLPVSDKTSNKEENIVHVAQVLGRSKDRKLVFEEIYFGKKKVKTASEIVEKTGLTRKRVTEEAIKLVNQQIIKKTEKNGELAYERDPFTASNKNHILKIAGRPKEISKIPTKRNKSVTIFETIKVHKSQCSIKPITIDDIDNFRKVRKIESKGSLSPIAEAKIKKLFKNFLKESGEFKDWGGERNDLFTSHVKINGKRYYAAFAFKGKGTIGVLTPKKMGKNADQIQRLFNTSGDVFMVQYCGQISETVLEQMEVYAKVKSISTGSTIYYGIIDGQDTKRLLEVYEK